MKLISRAQTQSPRRRAGTSLVEILVVIVVFLVGILAIVQIFPGGFKVLSTTAKNTIAYALGRKESDRLAAQADQMPDAIIPVSYLFVGGQIQIVADPDHLPGDIGPKSAALDATGNLLDPGGNSLGNWQFGTGANITRRVLGEGRIIPTPRYIGSQYGSLMSLQFAPIVYNPQYQSLFIVYGNDMSMRLDDYNGRPVRNYEFYLNEADNNQAFLVVPSNRLKNINYRLNASIVVDGGPLGPGLHRRDVVDLPVTVLADPSGAPAVFPLANLNDPPNPPLLQAGESLIGVEEDSVRLARQFDLIPTLPANNWDANHDPYEYKLLSPELGLVMFSPYGYNYFVRRSNGRRDPLLGRVSYDVWDWRIIRDEFRAPDTLPAQYRLAVGSLRVSGISGPDGKVNTGIGIPVPDGLGGLQNNDLVLQDTDTGGVFLFKEGTNDPNLTSYTVNKSIGLITFLDLDNDPSNGIQMKLIYPGDTNPTTVTVNNRNMRALYMGRSEWAVQVLKPSARYSQTYGKPGIGQFYIGGSDPGTGGLGNRLYFPAADVGRVISVGELFYQTTGSLPNPHGPDQLTATVIKDDQGLGGYIQVSDFLPDFNAFDYSRGTAARTVKGASVAVRVLWNPDAFTLTTDSTANMDRLDKWMQGWRRATVETYLQRGY